MRRHKYLFLGIIWLMLETGILGTAWGEGPYIDHDNGTVTDQGTGLMWQKADDGDIYSWRYALKYCEDLDLAGYRDWRLPNIRELNSIVDRRTTSPAIDPVFECKLLEYWSSTTQRDYVSSAWYVHFKSGVSETVNYKNTNSYVRCVREGLMGNQLKVFLDGRGRGAVTISPPGISCSDGCSQTYTYGVEVTLTAAAEPESEFYGWSGDCSGHRACTLTMNDHKTVTATFNRQVAGKIAGAQNAARSLILE